MNRNQNKQLNN